MSLDLAVVARQIGAADTGVLALEARPAVQRGLAEKQEQRQKKPEFTAEQRSTMVGDKQFERRWENKSMYDLYYWPTPNGWKISMLLEELEAPYNPISVNILKGEQFSPEFLKLNPNHKIPVLVDPDGPDGKPFSLFESGAILLYLAEKHGRFFAETKRDKYEVLTWVMFQMGNVGPFFGQANHFNRYAPEDVPYAKERYTNEANRLLGVMDKRLTSAGGWLATGQYTVADMACFGWVRDYGKDRETLEPFPAVCAWFDTIAARPATERAVAVMAGDRKAPTEMDDEARSIMFGDKQYTRR
jgi:GSH-dependent disulfide-bond oxidoreductase